MGEQRTHCPYWLCDHLGRMNRARPFLPPVGGVLFLPPNLRGSVRRTSTVVWEMEMGGNCELLVCVFLCSPLAFFVDDSMPNPISGSSRSPFITPMPPGPYYSAIALAAKAIRYSLTTVLCGNG